MVLLLYKVLIVLSANSNSITIIRLLNVPDFGTSSSPHLITRTL